MRPNVLYFTIVFSGSALTTAATFWVAHRNDWLVYPRSDRWNRAPVVKFGGVSILLTFLVAVIVCGASWPLRKPGLLTVPMGLMWMVDEIFELRPSCTFLAD